MGKRKTVSAGQIQFAGASRKKENKKKKKKQPKYKSPGEEIDSTGSGLSGVCGKLV